MKRKIVGIILMLILISSSLTLSVNAGSEENPEIEDETGECHRSIDIESAWFFEKPDEPGYLYVNMKLTNYKIFRIGLGQDFSVNFKINNESYHVTHQFPVVVYPLSYYTLTHEIRNVSITWDDYLINGHVNKIKGIISCKVPKSLIGNPESGDLVTHISVHSFYFLYMLSRLMIPTIIMQKFNISWYDLYVSGIPILKKFSNYFIHVFGYSMDFTGTSDKDYIIQY